MEFLYKRDGSPYWWARFKDPNGQLVQRSTKCRDKGAATRLLREWLRGAEHAAVDEAAGIERPSGISLLELAADYIEDVEKSRRPGYVRKLEQHIKIRILPYWGETTVAASINRQSVEAFRRALLSGTAPGNSKAKHFHPNEPMSVPTVDRHMTTLRRIFDFGVRAGLLRENPAANLPTLRRDQVERHRALDEHELDLLLAELPTEHARWVRFLVATGLRDDEAAQLDWRDVDLDRRVLVVRGTHAKSRKSRRVPLVRDALAVLDELGGDRIGLVFGRVNRRRSLESAWTRTHLPGRFPTAHDFRHTFASRAIALGLDLEELRAVLGHRSVVTTQKYLHDYGGRWLDMAKKLDARS